MIVRWSVGATCIATLAVASAAWGCTLLMASPEDELRCQQQLWSPNSRVLERLDAGLLLPPMPRAGAGDEQFDQHALPLPPPLADHPLARQHTQQARHHDLAAVSQRHANRRRRLAPGAT